MNEEFYPQFEREDAESGGYDRGDNNYASFIGEDSYMDGYICACPICKEKGREGKIIRNGKAYVCSNAIDNDNRNCSFILYKNNIERLIRREITDDEVNELCEEGSFKATCLKINDPTKSYTGIFSLRPMGTYYGLTLSFPD